jgi:alkylhydroperoxidase family enzyme
VSIASLLQQSKDAHLAYREALPRRVASGGGSTMVMDGDAERAGIHLVAACRFRAEAHVLDPKQADPAWADQAAFHDHGALLDFYVAQLTAEP